MFILYFFLYLQLELEQLKGRLERLEKERNEYKQAADRLETKVSVAISSLYYSFKLSCYISVLFELLNLTVMDKLHL